MKKFTYKYRAAALVYCERSVLAIDREQADRSIKKMHGVDVEYDSIHSIDKDKMELVAVSERILVGVP